MVLYTCEMFSYTPYRFLINCLPIFIHIYAFSKILKHLFSFIYFEKLLKVGAKFSGPFLSKNKRRNKVTERNYSQQLRFNAKKQVFKIKLGCHNMSRIIVTELGTATILQRVFVDT